MNVAKTILYTLSTCPVCAQAKEVLAGRNVEFEERVLDDREDWQNEVIALTSQYSVPVIIHGDGRVEVGIDGELG